MNPRLEPTELEVGMHYATTIDSVGRRWRMIAQPTRAYIMNRRTTLPWGLLALSLGLSMVVVVYLAQRLQLEGERSVLIAAEKQQRLLAETSTELTRQLLQKSERLAEELRAEQALLARRVDERTADLRVTNEELTRAAHAKDEFLANMSHELRTPLNSVLGFGEILLAELPGPLNDKQRTFLEYIGNSGRHLLELINDILDIAKDGAGKLQLQKEAVHVHEVCQSSLRVVGETTNRKRIALSFRADGLDNVFAWLDPKRLKQILLNLLGNAVKFTPEGGSVSLEVHADAKGKVLRFAVRDTGPGIASQDMSRLFQPFSQLDTRLSREHEGSGLGLMIVRRMVDMLQGSVTVESELGRGSCFTVALPWQLSERPSRQEIVVSSRLPPQSQRERILLVEDNENNIALMTEYLQIAGYRVQIARNGHEALVRAVEFMPELILMDIQLPRLDGLEVTRRLRQLALFRTTPLIVVTALVMPGDCERCLAAGANDYLSKPVSLEDLAAKIRAMLAAASVGGSNGS
jgi:signal transduction histidine kinase/CheY-like chemotaxis protein